MRETRDDQRKQPASMKAGCRHILCDCKGTLFQISGPVAARTLAWKYSTRDCCTPDGSIRSSESFHDLASPFENFDWSAGFAVPRKSGTAAGAVAVTGTAAETAAGTAVLARRVSGERIGKWVPKSGKSGRFSWRNGATVDRPVPGVAVCSSAGPSGNGPVRGCVRSGRSAVGRRFGGPGPRGWDSPDDRKPMLS